MEEMGESQNKGPDRNTRLVAGEYGVMTSEAAKSLDERLGKLTYKDVAKELQRAEPKLARQFESGVVRPEHLQQALQIVKDRHDLIDGAIRDTPQLMKPEDSARKLRLNDLRYLLRNRLNQLTS